MYKLITQNLLYTKKHWDDDLGISYFVKCTKPDQLINLYDRAYLKNVNTFSKVSAFLKIIISDRKHRIQIGIEKYREKLSRNWWVILEITLFKLFLLSNTSGDITDLPKLFQLRLVYTYIHQWRFVKDENTYTNGAYRKKNDPKNTNNFSHM